ncbi:putative porin [Pleionea mediterranea]|uniref:Putative general porin n=1 Tax=Pleionea mediterranea TaxID=523701 RepID=A0A316FY64_9GAMM|nr:putative porin [Pleionea mediterranea]PWK53353.1 putative general porin [Pleionea mediterranea]
MFKKAVLSFGFIISLNLSYAEDYQFFVDSNYKKLEADEYYSELFSLNGRYYFSKKQSLGPLSEFEYINKTSYLDVSYLSNLSEDTSDYGLSGDWFYSNFIIGATVTEGDLSSGYSSVRLGYLFSDNFKVQLERGGLDDDYDITSLTASYNHQINDTDYLGVTLYAEEQFDYKKLSTKYFTKLENDDYIALTLSYSKDDLIQSSKDYWSVGGEYFFSNYTSVSLGYDDHKSVSFGAEHYFNKNFGLRVNFQKRPIETFGEDEFDEEQLNISASLQF